VTLATHWPFVPATAGHQGHTLMVTTLPHLLSLPYAMREA